MRRLFAAGFALAVAMSCAVLPAAADDGTVCTSEGTPADAALAACGRLIAMKRFSGPTLAAIYFWRGVAYNKKGDYANAIGDLTESLRIQPNNVAALNMRGSAYFDKGEADIAIKDFNDAIRLSPPSAILFHNRGNAYLQKKDFAHAVADYDQAIALNPKEANTFQNRGAARLAMGDLDAAVSDTNEAIRLDPKLPTPLLVRGAVWRTRGDLDRALADYNEAIRLYVSRPKTVTITPQGDELVGAYVHRGLAYEGKGDLDRAKGDYNAALAIAALSADSKAIQNTAKARLIVLASAANEPALPAAPAGAPERRVALVIGNGGYAGANALPNPPNDARAVAKTLRDIGFDVSEGIDLDRAGMQKLVSQFLRGATGARIALLFYAGHGLQIDGRNYLVPVDAGVESIGSVVSTMADVDLILAGLGDETRTNIIMLDACRDNPFAAHDVVQASASRSLAVRSGLAAPSATALGSGAALGAGTLIAFATAPGQVALDGAGANSPFSAALMRHLGTPGLEVQQMLTRVRADVVAVTHNKQVPWSNSSLLGEVFLAGKP
jgi:tetratricopeptide (TPR) repeat protein